jgi:LmbE family N-acetylglucosaminyl deacetylase
MHNYFLNMLQERVKQVEEARKNPPLHGFDKLTMSGAEVSAAFSSELRRGATMSGAEVNGEKKIDILLFSPHPDDECIIGGIARRLQQENNYTIGNVAVTLGSNPERQLSRLQELQSACNYLNFQLIQTAPRGLNGINPKNRANQEIWQPAVARIKNILLQHAPKIIIFPHQEDGNSTHIATSMLVKDALAQMPPSFSVTCIQTEYWQAMTNPNLLVELSAPTVADLMTALSYHTGEIARNPYHLRLPDWLSDNVRRAELVGGQGSIPPNFNFATMYRVDTWRDGKFTAPFDKGLFVGEGDDLSKILELRYSCF